MTYRIDTYLLLLTTLLENKPAVGRNLTTRAVVPKLLAQLRVATAALSSLKNIVIDPQQDVLH